MNRLQINDRVTDMRDRDGTVVAISGDGFRLVTVCLDEGGEETSPEGFWQKRPGWVAMKAPQERRV